jgi:hypothetical protein
MVDFQANALVLPPPKKRKRRSSASRREISRLAAELSALKGEIENNRQVAELKAQRRARKQRHSQELLSLKMDLALQAMTHSQAMSEVHLQHSRAMSEVRTQHSQELAILRCNNAMAALNLQVECTQARIHALNTDLKALSALRDVKQLSDQLRETRDRAEKAEAALRSLPALLEAAAHCVAMGVVKVAKVLIG